ncbi:uncharacterized protein LOC115751220 isoform X2 [Rhodamnia argentea]|uniref:Uncharacterized protein LOC115751220 isoform X2 n=1 Tax=Rhodamnia argentea TaxID=178133 RepID=A0A8B8QF77_9MYRT|nr:uncharacterized protein LOC115751220 isoform X2 [Rhodamnia argentea]
MEVEKRRPKGGFLQFFDWNSKSRKKLFSNSPDIRDGVKQGTDDAAFLAESRLQMNVNDENGVSSSKSGSSEWNCAGSETSNEGCENRAPGVVARLMGLDSLPNSNGPESSTLCSEFHQVKASPYSDGTHDLQSRRDPIDYLSSSRRLGRFSSHPAEAKLLKAQNRPIERFQIEILPPKSAKPISITHHRLLSPIKGPRFIPAKNAAYVMEAAAKIIESSPRVVRGKASSTVSASAPLRIQDLKAKLESAYEASRQHKASSSGSVKNVKGKFNEKSSRIPQDTQPSRTAVVSGKVSPGNGRLKGKSSSLAEQGKVNVQTRQAKNQLNKKNLAVEKEHCGENSSQISNGLPRLQKSSQRKTSTSRTSIALKQNNQKQNSLSDRQGSVLRSSRSKQPARRTQPVNGSIGPSNTASKIAVKAETCSMTKLATNISKELKSSRFKTPAHKINSTDSDVNSNRSVTTNVVINSDGMSVKRNTVIDGRMNRGVDSNKNSMDVISFTFSSPIKRCSQEPRAYTGMHENGNFGRSFSDDNGPLDCKDSSSSSPIGSISDGNFLSVLLEQKLRELTDRIDLSNCDISREKSLSMPKISNQESVGILNSTSSVITENEESFQLGLDEVVSSPVVSACTSSDGPAINSKQECQGADSEEIEECSSSATSYAAGKETDYEHPSPVSTLESSFVSESCTDSVITYSGKKYYSSSQAPEVLDWLSQREFPTVECEDELSCSTSSSMTADAGTKWATSKESHSLYAGGLRSWELKYVEEIIGNVKLRLEDFGESEPKFMCNGLFNKLENGADRMDRYEEHSSLRRKLLFDCACECLELRCRDIVNGTCEAWAKWRALFQRKRWLAEDVYKEILGRKTIGDMMVDELVSQDMSTRLGRWVEFNVEVFEEGVEIGNRILTTLIDELFAEF